MPELPEVEVSRQGLLPFIVGQQVAAAVVRTPRLRHAITPGLAERLIGLRVETIDRRGKYLLFDCASQQGGGWLVLHLGMSGSLRLVTAETPAGKHDHFDLSFGASVLRLRDPRRFGALVWHEGSDIERHPLLAVLGIEPLSASFDGDWLYAATRERRGPIKPLLMDSRLVVGIGNIYAAESLFRAGVSPRRAANRISLQRYRVLAEAIRSTLRKAIAAGGSSVRDYVHSDGGAGCFQLSCAVYGRAGEPCPTCGQAVRTLRQSGRSTFYCAHCQR
ncbi:MAG TPA: bifunctional DNA-formamidopyrimidine glycosylase/DNA-(apurinic or apyrimidinic site) lyase [Accumulibacter sp.]|uniref:bifunctional DNA-formamidopyrimidine glycosylase/DNA-(apurinic or apyrimidinic site) lyase n=1 Tax=Accumulibacter sp. TaxID=2053492 RepID=UPI00287AC33E|nr:bifunctional DNA-formamidopyrimidine glycosylase/DNA-(apurinic or apyrimidinic site) lyase [Accumulibacter sp.]MDS4053621.1 bifunctional DNA-formamidopyrimidine glycosylase/DNA-(apurinic or apyrimidinic site) lyase [Accumulibacter sp.]HMV04961.1 bifunctional DNA-formamidopyrimidine glycosylase/DNA-(apurinic or apyrimidinic site) lyase [Accumulibacter sp.]HMW62924.1 bifunctional DNA-formamidopyrimidine glycosylase/DNA-(apurinic or apyrimidinic site) lyase [Accumulibacter sp.]HMW79111.1 bifunc